MVEEEYNLEEQEGEVNILKWVLSAIVLAVYIAVCYISLVVLA